jgi:hypothetical protein
MKVVKNNISLSKTYKPTEVNEIKLKKYLHDTNRHTQCNKGSGTK